jgi:hypothetical protein
MVPMVIMLLMPPVLEQSRVANLFQATSKKKARSIWHRGGGSGLTVGKEIESPDEAQPAPYSPLSWRRWRGTRSRSRSTLQSVPDAGFVHGGVLECRFGGLVGPQIFKQPQSGQGAECIRRATSFRNADAIGGAAAVVDGDEDAGANGGRKLCREAHDMMGSAGRRALFFERRN